MTPLLTDFYQLTMMAGYFRSKMHDRIATFDLYFRRAPFNGSHAIWAGLETALQFLSDLRFSETDLNYLKSLGFEKEFLDFLSDWRFMAKVEAISEGRVVFAGEPLLSITGRLIEVQLVETALLNILNFQTLVATKAARLVTAAKGKEVLEFGLRRAQGPNGALSAARAAFIGGVSATSNAEAGQAFQIPVRGTHAHSWVQAFDTELGAFRAWAKAFPDNCILLLDTYDTLECGLKNAITVGNELKSQGKTLKGVRLDSGDLAYLSRQVRTKLDEAGFPDAKIVAGNELDEFVIDSIIRENGAVDIYAVGTQLTTAGGPGGGALGGVYKLVEIDGKPKLKLTADREKTTLPGQKRLWRLYQNDQAFLDLIALDEETAPGTVVFDPTNPLRRTHLPTGLRVEDLRQTVMENGKITVSLPKLEELKEIAARDLKTLPEGSLRLLNPHRYRVSMSEKLHQLRVNLIEKMGG